MSRRLGVFASGRGSNFEAILQAIQAGELDADIVVLISDKEHAPALETAKAHGIPAVYHPYDRHDRETFERAADATLREHGVELVILAGFMRLITPFLIDAWRGRMLNIHPSLLPSFKGVDAQQQAFDYGVKITGCTVHEVSEEMDAGRMRRSDPEMLLLSLYSTVVGVATELEVQRAMGISDSLRGAVARRQELIRFLRAALEPVEHG